MEKLVTPASVPLGVSKQKPMKRTVVRKNKNKNKKHAARDLILEKAVSYLISDSYMYNPLVSPQPTFDFPPPKQILTSPAGNLGCREDVALPIKGRNKKLIEKVVDFLEADSYLYSPLITNERVSSKNHAENACSGMKESQGFQMQQGTGEEGGDLSRQHGRKPTIRKTAAYRESVKKMVH